MKSSKGLEELNRIKMLEISCDRESYDLRPITKTHKEDLKTIEKELKALEIIKEHQVEIWKVIDSPNYKEYVEDYCFTARDVITQEEYNLLKEVLL